MNFGVVSALQIRLSQNARCLVVLEPVPGSAGPVGHPVLLKSLIDRVHHIYHVAALFCSCWFCTFLPGLADVSLSDVGRAAVVSVSAHACAGLILLLGGCMDASRECLNREQH